ncbi:MAG: hypothetical protein JWQ18_579 [Conexibacter sp.]|nr:hypothetical protein [Conexibacter sp.]
MRTRLAGSAVLLSCLALAAPAGAAPWAKVTSVGTTTPADQVAVLFNSDASTSVAWNARTSPSTQSLFVTKVSSAGKVGATATVAQDWATLANPALAAGPAGVGTRVFFGGIHTTVTGDPNSDLNDAVSTDGGASWAVEPASIVAPGDQAYGSPVAAVYTAAGGFKQAWAATLGLFTHADVSAATPTVAHPSAPSPYDVGMSTDGGLNLAWYSNNAAAPGVYELDLALDGSESTAPALMPGTSGMTFGMSARTPIVALDGGEKWIAYPTGTSRLDRIRVWRVPGKAKPGLSAVLGRTSTNSYATITNTANGRLWVSWTDIVDGAATTYARRSNLDLTAWGATVEAGAPKHATSAYAVDGTPVENGELNLFASFSVGAAPGTATYVTHVLPGLSLARDSGSLTDGKEHTLRFEVTDAGDPVAKATVKLGGESATTNSHGVAELEVTGHGSKMTAKASALRYVGADLDLKVHH